ncbi:MAG TPA: hypothetical protein VKB58_13480 [Terriglobales bacterium]|nr:hypothetical protein [Terriglobales bacterium]
MTDVVLPRFGLVFFNHLIGEYESFVDRADGDAEAHSRVGVLREIYVKNVRPLTWGDLAALECLLLRLRTTDELRERFWALEARYREVAPISFVDELPKMAQADLDKLPDAKLRAHIEVVACEFFRLCMLASCRETMRARASYWVSAAMVCFLAAFALPRLFFSYGQDFSFSRLTAILFAGAMGGFISAQRRIQRVSSRGESLIDLIELSSLSGNFLAPVAGAVFAAVLYVMFAGGFLTGPLFPTIKTSSTGSTAGVFSAIFSSTAGPESAIDSAKLLIWCFIAGFAERFVPNALDRFVAKAEIKKKASGA